MRRILLPAFAALLLLTSPALAAGKAGLWTVTTTWQFGMRLRAAARWWRWRASRGFRPPVNGQPFIHHMCMTPYEADGRQPLHLNSRDYGLRATGWSACAAR